MDDPILEMLSDGFREKRNETIIKLIDYCRIKEKEHAESCEENTISGVRVLTEMVQQGQLPVDIFIKALPIVQSYKEPYEINFIEE